MWDLIIEGPDDDLAGVETCCPKLYFNNSLWCLTDTV